MPRTVTPGIAPVAEVNHVDPAAVERKRQSDIDQGFDAGSRWMLAQIRALARHRNDHGERWERALWDAVFETDYDAEREGVAT